MSVYQVEEDGTLSSLDDLFFGDEMAQDYPGMQISQ
ncbi:hypothetical protein SAMN04488601_1012849 [Paenibacillus sp. 453mf]|nr:hypothetical protein SAMN04488601_1012849 [Paenibacillus sp. 453mf]